MLTKEEILFLEYWEKQKEKQSRWTYQLLAGLPRGLIFALPVLVAVIFDGWYKSMVYISNAQMILIIITVLGIAVFFAFISERFKSESNEQLYKELKFKEGRDKAANK